MGCPTQVGKGGCKPGLQVQTWRFPQRGVGARGAVGDTPRGCFFLKPRSVHLLHKVQVAAPRRRQVPLTPGGHLRKGNRLENIPAAQGS